MKVGDLVRLVDDREVHMNNGEIPPDAIGIVVEVPSQDVFGPGGALDSRWVQWNGRWDWDSMYIEDLEIISESRS